MPSPKRVENRSCLLLPACETLAGWWSPSYSPTLSQRQTKIAAFLTSVNKRQRNNKKRRLERHVSISCSGDGPRKTARRIISPGLHQRPVISSNGISART